MSKLLIVVGSALVIAGLLWPLAQRLGLGRLPGDIALERDGFSFYFPIVTCLVISIVVSVVLWLFRR